MHKINIKMYGMIKSYHEICQEINDIMVCNDNDQKEKSTPMDHVLRYIRRNIYYMVSVNRLVPDQDIHFFYTRSHLSALQNCALFSQLIFCLFSHLKIHYII